MRILTPLFLLAASPAFAAGDKPFFSLKNTDFVVLIAFIAFFAVLAYFKVPQLLMGLLDKRAEGIRSELDEARALREEAQSVLASYERKQSEVQAQAEQIVAHARDEAQAAAKTAMEDIKTAVARRIAAAEEQIESAKTGAVRQVRDQAIQVAVAAASDVIAKELTAADADAMIDDAIKTVEARLH